ncbi:O-antigen ligase family protein [Nakamurella flavida]|uniref:O-antigen ligase family protein n=1 Tax=Nakamurella flavida TaxID=363630 RepID=A0A938YKR3_9ACTN|nr:O-antigen ligase family protein [Nakamurella flavida]MBM9477787.1 O-antigen ligase family protein [Nakamurella flavida]MDP9779340.1 O-antigen ligase [Nakamurella flavida]
MTVAVILMYPRPQGLSGTVIALVGIVLLVVGLLVGIRPTAPPVPTVVFVMCALASAVVNAAGRESSGLAEIAAMLIPLGMAGSIVTVLSFERFIQLADRALKAVVCLSLVVAFLIPSIGVTQRDVNAGAIRGIYEHRNGFAYVIALALVTHLAACAIRGGYRSSLWWVPIFGFGMLGASSVSALALVAVSVALYLWVRLLRGLSPEVRSMVTLAASSAALLIALAATLSWSRLLDAFDREDTFLSRTEIWQGAVTAWRERPLLGFGWGNVLGADDSPAAVIAAFSGYDVRSTHNGYLAVALQLGVVGLVVALGYLAGLVVLVLRRAASDPSGPAAWALQIVVILVLGDLVETRAFVNIGWFLLAVIWLYVKGANRSCSSASID